jgi:hypothetical protein
MWPVTLMNEHGIIEIGNLYSRNWGTFFIVLRISLELPSKRLIRIRKTLYECRQDQIYLVNTDPLVTLA